MNRTSDWGSRLGSTKRVSGLSLMSCLETSSSKLFHLDSRHPPRSTTMKHSKRFQLRIARMVSKISRAYSKVALFIQINVVTIQAFSSWTILSANKWMTGKRRSAQLDSGRGSFLRSMRTGISLREGPLNWTSWNWITTARCCSYSKRCRSTTVYRKPGQQSALQTCL